jgi:Tol biopolymer transport system component
LTFGTGATEFPAISRDGKLLAYSADRGGVGATQIWVQPVAGGSPVEITHSNANHTGLDTVSITITGPTAYSYSANGTIAGGDIVVKQ